MGHPVWLWTMGILSIQTSTSASLCQGNSEAIRINQDPAFTAGALITPIWLIDCQLYHVVHSGSLRFLAFEFVFPANSFPENMDFPWPSWFSGGFVGAPSWHIRRTGGLFELPQLSWSRVRLGFGMFWWVPNGSWLNHWGLLLITCFQHTLGIIWLLCCICH